MSYNIRERYSEIARAREIVAILIKHGLGDFFDQIGLGRYLKVGRGFFREEEMEAVRLSPKEHARLALEELGPTFIKLGQILSTRPDIIPSDWAEEFAKLQDSAPPLSWQQIEDIIRREFHNGPLQIFKEIERTPIASASLSQVHKARLKNGRIAAVKIQRPNIEAVIENDLKIMRDLATLVERRFSVFRLYSPSEVIDEFSRAIGKELDFKLEGRHFDIFRRNFADMPEVAMPEVFWEYTTPKVLTMEFIDGVKISDFFVGKAKTKGKGIDPKIIAQNGARAVLKQVFEDGFFHADPHPANIFVLKNNRIALLDVGQVGRLDNEAKEQFAKVLLGIVEQDSEIILSALEALEIIPYEADRKAIKKEIKIFIDQYWGVPLKDIQIGRIILELIEMMIKFNIRMPDDFALLAKALLTSESVGRQVDPDFDMVSNFKPFAQKLLAQRWSPKDLLGRSRKSLKQLFEIFERLPGDLQSFLRLARRGRLLAQFELKNLDKLIYEIDRASNDIAFALIIAALIIGSSIVMALEKGPQLLGYPAFGVVGYVLSAILGVWLVIYILRRRIF